MALVGFPISLAYTWILLWKADNLSHSQLQVLFLLTVYRFSIFDYKECNQSDFGIDHLVMSMYKVVSFVVEKGCLLWPVCSLGIILLVFALLHFVLQGQTSLLLQVSLDFLLLHSNPLWVGHLFLVLVLGGLLGLHRTGQLQLLRHQWWGHKLEFQWCWMVCLGNELRSYCHFWVCTQVLHFWLFCWLWRYSISSAGFLLTVVDIVVIWIKFTHSCPF